MRLSLTIGALVSAAASAACSSHLQRPDAGGSVVLDSAALIDGGIPSGGFITADVDGVTIRAELQAVSYWFSGIQPSYIAAEATSAEWTWGHILQNSAGPDACGGGYFVLYPVGSPAQAFATFGGGVCNVTVTAAAPTVGDVLEGTFSGTILASATMMRVVTNGAFRVPRIAERPPQ